MTRMSSGSVLGVVFVGRASRPGQAVPDMTEGDREVADDTRRHLSHVARGGAIGLVGAGVSAVAGFVLVLVVTNTLASTPPDCSSR